MVSPTCADIMFAYRMILGSYLINRGFLVLHTNIFPLSRLTVKIGVVGNSDIHTSSGILV